MVDYAKPEDAYWAFFEAFNAKSREGWADVMSYPHTRVSARGSARYFETPKEYADGASWETIEATGWVRTRGIEPERVHESDDKVHLAAGWTRYDAQDRPILSNRVTYILTLVDGSWGIQARFGTDFYSEDEALLRESAQAAEDVVRRLLDALMAGDVAGAAALCALPFTEVGVGEVRRLESASALEERLREAHRGAAMAEAAVEDVRAAQVGTAGVNVAVTLRAGSDRLSHGLYLAAKGEDGWRVSAHSRVSG